jgi:hypothetical protein
MSLSAKKKINGSTLILAFFLPSPSLLPFLARRFSFPFGWLPDRYMVGVRKFADWSICIRKILYPYMFSSFDPVCEQENFSSSFFYLCEKIK